MIHFVLVHPSVLTISTARLERFGIEINVVVYVKEFSNAIILRFGTIQIVVVSVHLVPIIEFVLAQVAFLALLAMNE